MSSPPYTYNPLPITPSQLNYADTSQWKQILKGALDNVRCATPAFTNADMNANQTVNVQIAIQERVRVANGLEWYDIPQIQNVPVILPRGGGFSLTMPLKKGDEGMLIFCDTCFDNWWANGTANSPKAANAAAPSGTQTQLEVRRHDVTDCGFYPGMWSQPNVLSNYSTTSAQLRRDDGSALVDISDGLVQVMAHGGTAQALVNDTFYQWYVANVQPFLVSKGYAGPPIPTGSETTILKGQ